MSDYVQLTPSQKFALRVLQENVDNVFLTGSPGTGKSFLISHYLKIQKAKIPVVASTGAAALLVGGRTFHSFFSLGIMQGGPEFTFNAAVQNGRLRKRLQGTDTLVIDEISMLSGETLDCAEKIARFARESAQPWGGIRIVAVGDFAQLPPIGKGREKEWAFLSESWKRTCFRKVSLMDVVRTEDKDFLKILESIRWGVLSSGVEDFLNQRLVYDEEVEANTPHIFPRRSETESYNRLRLSELPAALKRFETSYGGAAHYIDRLMNDAPIPPVLELKKQALVMLRINDPKQRFINGTVGTITDMDENTMVIDTGGRRVEIEPFTFTMLDADGEEVAFARNFPVTLAYANTIHKMQGTTLDRAHISLKSLWEPGQAYVALSRARSGRGITLMGWDAASIKSDQAVKEFYGAGEALASL